MDDSTQGSDQGTAFEHAAPGAGSLESEPAIPPEPLPPITSRFLFVDVAALRAKQLRRGAKMRYAVEEGVPAARKPERVAMEEVRRGLVYYDVPAPKGRQEHEEEA